MILLRNAGVIPVCKYVVSTAQVPICKVQDNSSWLGECFIACVLQCVSASVYKHIQYIPIGTVGKCETLYPPLGWFVGHVLFSSEPASKPHHRFIHCQLTTWIVTCVESCEQRVEEQLDFVDSLHSTRGEWLTWNSQKSSSNRSRGITL